MAGVKKTGSSAKKAQPAKGRRGSTTRVPVRKVARGATRKPAKKATTNVVKVAARKPASKAAGKAAKPPAAPRSIIRIRDLDPYKKCGAGTSVERLVRVDEMVDRRLEAHLVFLDRHGWYCEHGRSCHAVGHARKHKE